MRENLKEAAMEQEYRLLKVGVIIERCDEFNNGLGWNVVISSAGMQVGDINIRNGKYRRPIKSVSRTSTNSRMGSPKPSQICPHCKGSGKLPHAADVRRNTGSGHIIGGRERQNAKPIY